MYMYRLSSFIFDLSFLYSYHQCFLTFLEVLMLGKTTNNIIFSVPIYRFFSLMILFYYNTGICADGLSNGYDIYLKVVYSVSLSIYTLNCILKSICLS